jgi:hypothetical protein
VSKYSLSHLTDHALLCDLSALVAQDRVTTAELLAHIAEVDARKLYVPAAYPSMYAYCVGELRLSEDAAAKRIQAARAARQFPVLFETLADGRLHLSGACLLAPHLARETADELLAAAAGKTKSEIAELVAQRFPCPEVPPRVQPLGPPLVIDQHASGQVETRIEPLNPEIAQAPTAQHAPGHVEVNTARPRVKPLGPERYVLQVTIGRETHEKLRHAQALLGHQIPTGDLAQVLDRVLDLAIGRLERQKFAAAQRPRLGRRRTSANGRYIPAHVKRAVWERDGGQCTFMSEAGRRCAARARLEFDHVEPVARGGQATIDGMRLRCRAHNQYAAEETFGAAFMRHKRHEAKRAAQSRAGTAAATERAKERASEVIPWLRSLGFRADEARRAAERCQTVPDAPLEERVRVALSFFGPRQPVIGRAAPA